MVAVERTLNKVLVEFTFSDHYGAMLLYDQMIKALEEGTLELKLGVTPRQP